MHLCVVCIHVYTHIYDIYACVYKFSHAVSACTCISGLHVLSVCVHMCGVYVCDIYVLICRGL